MQRRELNPQCQWFCKVLTRHYSVLVTVLIGWHAYVPFDKSLLQETFFFFPYISTAIYAFFMERLFSKSTDLSAILCDKFFCVQNKTV